MQKSAFVLIRAPAARARAEFAPLIGLGLIFPIPSVPALDIGTRQENYTNDSVTLTVQPQPEGDS